MYYREVLATPEGWVVEDDYVALLYLAYAAELKDDHVTRFERRSHADAVDPPREDEEENGKDHEDEDQGPQIGRASHPRLEFHLNKMADGKGC